jgi:hypothetical protein
MALGFLRVHVGSNNVAEDLLTTLWLLLWDEGKQHHKKGIERYGPFKARFAASVRYYADRVQKQYHSSGSKEIIASALAASDAEGDNIPAWIDRVPDPGLPVEVHSINTADARRLLRAMGHSTSPPHQVVIFGLNRLLAWKPREIVTELSADFLRRLETRLEHDLAQAMPLAWHETAGGLQRLRQNMEVPFGIVVRHPKTREAHVALLERTTGDIVLREFYTMDGNPEDDVARWSHNVWRGIRIMLLEEEL